MDNFFTQKNCDRCGKSLKDGRIKVCLTANVSYGLQEKRMCRFGIQKGTRADIAEIRKGNYNFKGIRG